MSEIGQGQLQDQLHNIVSSLINDTSEGKRSENSVGYRLPKKRPRAPGALRLLQVYEVEQGQRAKGKGGIIAPQTVLLEWIKKLVGFLTELLGDLRPENCSGHFPYKNLLGFLFTSSHRKLIQMRFL